MSEGEHPIHGPPEVLVRKAAKAAWPPPWSPDEALLEACSAGNISKVKYLDAIDTTAYNRQEGLLQLLHEATEKQQVAVVDYLLQHTFSTNFSADMIISACSAGLDIYKLYHTKQPQIINWGCGPNVFSSTVCWAVRGCNSKFLSYLLRNGAGPGWFVENSSRTFNHYLPIEWTVLQLQDEPGHKDRPCHELLRDYAATAIYRDYKPILKLLLEYEILRTLVEAGGDVNNMLDLDNFHNHARPFKEIPRLYGTALSYAASNGHAEAVKYLLNHGADATKCDSLGVKAIERAQEYDHPEVVALIGTYESERNE
ncbi:ankyrin [Mytilinidion resinicola]|uniref:Ankyrin n=1 Tax=Mytilinidion resinicola TaxID=574789 RepID=A0A6A6YSK3_9PEZI|nr:ankyrin [Mytilinidion resinicola]KAF2811780.1 ankyrin [Mytilinidion resinicola]